MSKLLCGPPVFAPYQGGGETRDGRAGQTRPPNGNRVPFPLERRLHPGRGRLLCARLIAMKLLLRLFAVLLSTLAVASAQNAVPAGNPAGNTPPAVSAAPAPATADSTVAAPAGEPAAEESYADMLRKGGVTIYFLIGLSVIMCALIAFYVLTIRRGAVVSDHFM